MKQTLEWFKNRIGKTVYRDDFDNDGTTEVKIENEFQANYMYELNTEVELNYKDKN